MNECFLTTGDVISAPPCSSMEQVEAADWLIFKLIHGLTQFTREVTTAERATGINHPHALVTQTGDGVRRYYGIAIPSI